MVTVGDEIDFIAYPHRHNILGLVLRDVLHALAVVNPDIVSLTAAVVLPGTELAHSTVICKFLSIRRIAAETTFRKRQFLTHSSLIGYGPELADKAVADTVSVDDVPAVRRPAHHDIVRAHTVAEVVPAVGGGIGQALRLSSPCRNGVHFSIAIILGSKGNGIAVRRISGEHFVTDVGGEAHGLASAERRLVKVTCVGEDYILSVGGRETEQTSFFSVQNTNRCRHKQHTYQQSFHCFIVNYLPYFSALAFCLSALSLLSGWSAKRCASTEEPLPSERLASLMRALYIE